MQTGEPGDIHRGMCLLIFGALHGGRNPLAEAIGAAVRRAQQEADAELERAPREHLNRRVEGLRELEDTFARRRHPTGAVDAAWPLVVAALDREGQALLQAEYRAMRTVLRYMAAQGGSDGPDGQQSLKLLERAGAILAELPHRPLPPRGLALAAGEQREPAAGAAAHVAMRMLMHGDTELAEAFYDALQAAVTDSEQALEGASTIEHHKRRAELLELAAALHDGPLMPAEHDHRTAWRLLLAHLPQAQQERLEAELLRVIGGLEQDVAEEAPAAAYAMDSLELFSEVEQLVSELPYTTIPAPPLDDDDDDEKRRRTLRVEVERSDGAIGPPAPLCALVRDGYQTLIARMSIMSGDDEAWWQVEIHDPPPGREVRRDLPAGARGARLFSESWEATDRAQEQRLEREANALLDQAAEGDLADALRWVLDELRGEYVLASQ